MVKKQQKIAGGAKAKITPTVINKGKPVGDPDTLSKISYHDNGNGTIKVVDEGTGALQYEHALTEISREDWTNSVSRARSGASIRGGAHIGQVVKINGVPVAFGQAAYSFNPEVERANRSAKYTREYYGRFVAYNLAQLYKESKAGLTVYVNHPPGDEEYRGQIVEVVQTTKDTPWVVELPDGRVFKFSIKNVNPYDEPLGGYYSMMLTDDGMGYRDDSLRGQKVLMLDLGEVTLDFISFDGTGEPEYLKSLSRDIGVSQIKDHFWQSLRADNLRSLQGIDQAPDELITDALRTGRFKPYGLDDDTAIPCQAQADASFNLIGGRLLQAYTTHTKRGVGYRVLGMTGGGSGMLETKLRQTLKHPNMRLARDVKEIQRANVKGIRAVARMGRLKQAMRQQVQDALRTDDL